MSGYIRPKNKKERIKDAIALFNVYNKKVGVFIPPEVWASLESYGDARKFFSKLGLTNTQAKDIAWVFTCPRPWDQANSKPYLARPENCKWYRRWDQIAESFNNFVTGFYRPMQY